MAACNLKHYSVIAHASSVEMGPLALSTPYGINLTAYNYYVA